MGFSSVAPQQQQQEQDLGTMAATRDPWSSLSRPAQRNPVSSRSSRLTISNPVKRIIPVTTMECGSWSPSFLRYEYWYTYICAVTSHGPPRPDRLDEGWRQVAAGGERPTGERNPTRGFPRKIGGKGFVMRRHAEVGRRWRWTNRPCLGRRMRSSLFLALVSLAAAPRHPVPKVPLG